MYVVIAKRTLNKGWRFKLKDPTEILVITIASKVWQIQKLSKPCSPSTPDPVPVSGRRNSEKISRWFHFADSGRQTRSQRNPSRRRLRFRVAGASERRNSSRGSGKIGRSRSESQDEALFFGSGRSRITVFILNFKS
jgi:hypothetical protein